MIEWLQEHFQPGPGFGVALAVFAGMTPLMWWQAHRATSRPALHFSAAPGLTKAGHSLAARLRNLPLLVRTLAVVALLLALARPQSGGAHVDSRKGIAIQVVLDISGSMRSADFVLDNHRARRLDAVKRVFEDFVLGTDKLPGRENDLIGMTTFAMFADTRCPLTLDHASLADLLRQAEIPGWVDGQQVRDDPEAGYTAMGDAIVLATDDLRRAGDQAIEGVPGAEAAKSKIMVLLTDGADSPYFKETSPDPIEAAKAAATLGIKIYTIGAIGNAPRRRGAFDLMTPRIADVDEPTLKKIAEITGGKYFRATDTDSLTTICAEIDKLEKAKTGQRQYRDNLAASKRFMLAAMGLVLFEVLMSCTRLRRFP